MPRFGANLTMMFNERPFLDRFAAASQAGFKAVEYLFSYDHRAELVGEAFRAAGLRQALFNLPPGDWSNGERGLAALPERKAEFRASVDKAVRYGRAIGTPLLHMMAGIADARDVAARAAYLDALEFAADAAGAAGIGVVIEPINARDMPGYFLDDFERAAEIITEVDHTNVGLQFDIYHRQVMRGDVTTALKAFMPLIRHVQVASVPDRHEPGTGELDDFRILRLLDELGYQGYVGCEYRPKGETVSGLSWLAAFGERPAANETSRDEV